ncbi:universal stress protein [Actinosynnema sp. NPDC059335]|uniref:universal stress protein n=1 Tax=Actinosynnema sp. NPDC059335 TaxID=3346804 RepID=UPI00366AC5DB
MGGKVVAVERPGAAPVVAIATAVAEAIGATVVTVPTGRDAVLGALRGPDAVLGVVPRDQHSSWTIARASARPVVLVPPMYPGTSASTAAVSRVLVPLDGTAESARAVVEVLGLLARANVDLVVLHVFDEATVPPFWDQAAHARHDWEREFRKRFCTPEDVRLELRSGRPGDRVNQVAAEEHAHLIALGWSRRLDEGRARTVRDTVRGARVPVMLVPLASVHPHL